MIRSRSLPVGAAVVFGRVFALLILAIALSIPHAQAQKKSLQEIKNELAQSLTPKAVVSLLDLNIEFNGEFSISRIASKEPGLTLDQSAFIKVLAVYFDLHESELVLRSLNEAHSSAYVRWNRSRNNQKLRRASPVDVSEKLSKVEKTRLAYYKERSRNALLRLYLEEIISIKLKEELTDPPQPMKFTPPNLIASDLLVKFKKVDADFRLRQLISETVHKVNNAWQGIIYARADMDFLQKNLMLQQQIYQQERSLSLGSAMIDQTAGEASLIRATGDFLISVVKLSFLLEGNAALRTEKGKLNIRALDEKYLFELTGTEPGVEKDRVLTKDGSGFGQNDAQ
ncbi:MAG: hypothetical protein OEY85_07935 [Rhodospirillales bacterium]|nr:hypothetical protein [Rhodospirillales bacterium]